MALGLCVRLAVGYPRNGTSKLQCVLYHMHGHGKHVAHFFTATIWCSSSSHSLFVDSVFIHTCMYVCICTLCVGVATFTARLGEGVYIVKPGAHHLR